MSKFLNNYFSSSGSWVCPAGVTKVYLLGQGGGSGGSGAANAAGNYSAAPGGNATTCYLVAVDVVPNTTYTITIGAGGTGGPPVNSVTSNGGTGGNTTFGSLHTFYGALRGLGYSLPGGTSPVPVTYDIGHTAISPGYATSNFIPQKVANGFLSTTLVRGSNSSPAGGIGGYSGAAGHPGSVGGVGGNGVYGGPGQNGGNASGFGAGGGGAGVGYNAGTYTNGTGGNGAPGQLWVMWVE